MSQVLLNGQAYDFTQIVCNIAGVPVVGITELNYTEEQEKVNNMGTGNRPVSRGRGPINSSGSISLSMNEVVKLRQAAKNLGIASGSLNKLPAFEIVVTYVNAQQPVTDKLRNVEFIDDGVETSQGDTDIVRTFGLIISDIKYNTQ